MTKLACCPQWEVGAMVLEVLHKILVDYEVSADDFIHQTIEIQGEGTTQANKPPGFTLMEHLLNDSSMMKMVKVLVSL